MDAHVKGAPLVEHYRGSIAFTILDALDQHANADLQRLACINAQDDTECFTYRQLHTRCLAVAAFLRDRGIGEGDMVSYYGPNSWLWMCAFVGATANKAAFVGMFWRDNDFTIDKQVQLAKPSVVFTSTDKLSTLYNHLNGQPHSIKLVIVFDSSPSTHNTEELRLPVEHVNINHVLAQQVPANFETAKLDDMNTLAWMCMTSGTTGNAKFRMVSHAALIARMNIEREAFFEEHAIEPFPDKGFVYSPQTNMIGALETMITHMFGMTAVILASTSPEEVLRCIERHRISRMIVYSGILATFATSSLVDSYDVTSIKKIQHGGVKIGANLIEKAKKRLGLDTVLGIYGATEFCGTAFLSQKDDPVDCCGRILSSLEAKVVNPTTGQTIKCDEPGELLVRGPTVATAYYNNPQANAKAFLPDGWYRTGDYVRLDAEGRLYHICRMAEIYNVDGEQVLAPQLEALLTSHIAVEDAGVIGVPMNAAQQRLYAFVVLKCVENINEQALREYFNSTVKSQAQQLRAPIQFMDRLPRQMTGKLCRMDLEKLVM